MKKKIGIALLVLLIGIQFIKIDKENPSYTMENDFATIHNAPDNISTLLKNACYDCHSHQTQYPWYSHIAPISWWLKGHINEGREHANFSKWTDYNAEQQQHIIEECIEVIEEKEMPLTSYTLTHSDAKLTDADRSALVQWFQSLER